MSVSDLEQLPVQEATPVTEAPKAAKEKELEPRGLARKAFEKITSLKVFQEQQANLFAYVSRKTDECIDKSAAKLAGFVSATNLSPGRAEKVAATTQVQEKLAANEARFRAALTSFKERISGVAASYAQERLTPSPAASETQPKSPEGAAERREKIIESAQAKRAGLLKRTFSGAIDLIPFVGGAKMAAEAVAGADSAGEEMTGTARVIHGAMGIASVVLDFTGIGEAGKAIGLVGKSVSLMGRAAEKLLEKGAVKTASLVTKTAIFMGKHPKLVLEGEKLAEQKIGAVVKNIADYRKGTRPSEDLKQAA
jgi:hypothetical protein